MNNILKNSYYVALLFTGSIFGLYENTPLKDLLPHNNPHIQHGQYSEQEQKQIRATFAIQQKFRNYVVDRAKVKYSDFIQDSERVSKLLTVTRNIPQRGFKSLNTNLLMDAITYNALSTIKALCSFEIKTDHCALALAEESKNPELLKLVYAPWIAKRERLVLQRLNNALQTHNNQRFCFILMCYPSDPQTNKPITLNDLNVQDHSVLVHSAILALCQPTKEELQQKYSLLFPSETSSATQLIYDTKTTNLNQALENYTTRLTSKRSASTRLIRTLTRGFDPRLLARIADLAVPNCLDQSAVNYLKNFRALAKLVAPIGQALQARQSETKITE